MKARHLLWLFAGVLQPAFADELGRIFFTPEQRALLELAQQQATAADAEGEGVTLNGIVVGSDGRQTVWVNGRPKPDARAVGPGAALIPLPAGPGQVRLKVGQTLDPITGRVGERLRRPAATPTPPSPQATRPVRQSHETSEAEAD
jgi:hypothetical protein